MTLKDLVGKEAPPVSLTNYDGEPYTLKPGEDNVPVVLFFYPKAGSYGCTKEACQFRDAVAEKDTFKTEKLKLVGISMDPVAKQKAFVEKNKLTYPVLSDEKGEVHDAYHIGKALYGLTGGRARVTVIIDSKGIVRDSLESTLNFASHPKFVTKWLEKLEEESKGKRAPSTENVAPGHEVEANAAEHVSA